MIVKANQISLGGAGGDYLPNSEFAQASQILDQSGAAFGAFVYVVVPAGTGDNDTELELLGFFALDSSGKLMNSASHDVCLPCPQMCP